MEQSNIMRARTIDYGLSESDIYDAVRKYIEMFTDLPVIYGNQNAPLPKDSVVMTMLFNDHKSTVSTVYNKEKSIETSRRTTHKTFQIDVYGKDAGQVYDAIVVLSQNPTSYQDESELSPNVDLLKINERGRWPFTNEQQNYENRYSMEMEFSIYNEVSRTIDFIESINVKTIEV